MKKFVLLISVAAMALLGGTKVSAQGKYGPDSTECIKYLSYYTEYYKQKNYDAALPNWRQAYKYCPPTARYSMLSDGTTLIRSLIQKNQNNPVYKQQLVDSLMKIYDQRVQYWPKYAVSSLNNMALALQSRRTILTSPEGSLTCATPFSLEISCAATPAERTSCAPLPG